MGLVEPSLCLPDSPGQKSSDLSPATWQAAGVWGRNHGGPTGVFADKDRCRSSLYLQNGGLGISVGKYGEEAGSVSGGDRSLRPREHSGLYCLKNGPRGGSKITFGADFSPGLV